jgi:hypothetical protein
MRISKKAMVLLVPGILFGIGATAWSGNSDQQPAATAQVAPASPYGNTLLGMLSSILTDTDTTPQPKKDQCRASHLYSQHDVVGDPEACFMGHYNFGSGSGSAAGVP